MDDDHIKALANLMSSSMDAYQKGRRIDDSMTFEQAEWLNFGRMMYAGIKDAEPINPKVISAEDRFNGGGQ